MPMLHRPSRRAFAPRVDRAEGRLLMSALGVDNRVPVANTTAYPYSAVVHIAVTFPDGEAGTASGAMIGATHVLTAAHNIYNRDWGGWASVVTVSPGQVGNYIPLGTYKAVRETTYTGYTNSDLAHHLEQGVRFDVALLRLSTPVVPGVGALGQEVRNDAFFHVATLTTSGYPGDLPAGSPLKGKVMYTVSGRATGATPWVVHYTFATASGQSGSALYRTDATGTYIDAVHSYGLPGGAPTTFNNGGVRLTSVVFDDLKTWSAVDSVANTAVFAHAALPHDPTTFRVTTPFTPQGLMHVMTA